MALLLVLAVGYPLRRDPRSGIAEGVGGVQPEQP